MSPVETIAVTNNVQMMLGDGAGSPMPDWLAAVVSVIAIGVLVWAFWYVLRPLN
jgi:hypothetical protein